MTKTKHTLGPWLYQEGTKTIRSKENYWVATMGSWDGAINNEANARLIAAAPELLEACKRALNRLDELGENKNDNRTAEFIYKAIAKAEGRE